MTMDTPPVLKLETHPYPFCSKNLLKEPFIEVLIVFKEEVRSNMRVLSNIDDGICDVGSHQSLKSMIPGRLGIGTTLSEKNCREPHPN